MKKKNLITLFFILSLLPAFTSCGWIPDPPEPDPEPEISKTPDEEGNIVIINKSGQELLLVHNNQIFRKIPANSNDFLLWIENPNDISYELQVYKASDITNGEIDISKVFKIWKINLSDSKDIEKRVTWFISKDETEVNSGTIKFSYVGGTDNHVDVLLNNKNGAKIITLKPGDQYESKVGIDYGNYTLHYRYWYSDPNTNQAETEIGWIEKEVVANMETDIWVVLNNQRQEKFVFVPHFDDDLSDLDKYATIEIQSLYPEPIRIEINGELIEEVMYLDGNTQNSSVLAYGDKIPFVIDKGEDYQLVAKTNTHNTVIAQENLNLMAGQKISWKISTDENGNIISEIY